ncbi:LysR substrate-binding domain-containing protein [Pseudomonas sp. GL-R-26]|uniref:LysR substrate-binding domain-containing protein n=1 Tax=Pseudomonas sp. GL-R-26 TaxID=2832392 RepID=UPI001CBBBE31|nr:LysR substrate-binding domain-containing protein [Pseudomonas sp. GL-R-26]
MTVVAGDCFALPNQEDRLDPCAMPLEAKDFRGLAPAFIAVAKTDPLRDHGLAYRDALLADGGRAASQVAQGVVLSGLRAFGVATERATSDVSLDCLRLHSSPSFGLLWLMPRLEQFRQSHPDIQLNLSCSYESLHFSRDKIDVDIRHGMPNWPSFEVRTVRNEKIAVMASPKLLEKRPICAVADLLDCNLILSEATLIKWPQLFAQHGLSRPEKPYSLSFDRSYMTLEAASHGLGFALESTLLAQDYLARGALVEVAPELSATITAHHLVFPRAHSNFPRVRRFLEWMQKELGHDFNY